MKLTTSVIEYPFSLLDIDVTRAMGLRQVGYNMRNDFWHVVVVQRDSFPRELMKGFVVENVPSVLEECHVSARKKHGKGIIAYFDGVKIRICPPYYA